MPTGASGPGFHASPGPPTHQAAPEGRPAAGVRVVHDTGSTSWSADVPHERVGVRMARHAFADEMAAAGVGDEARDDAMLVLSELVSNAVRHAAPLPSGQITVRWALEDDAMHIEITDGGAGTRPRAGVAALSSLGGRGLDIVRTVSRQWGVTEASGSVTVWADVPRSPEDGHDGTPGRQH